MGENNYLFKPTNDLSQTFDIIISQVSNKINSYQHEYLFNVRLEELAEYLYDEHCLEAPKLLKEKVEIHEEREEKIRVNDAGRRIYVDGYYFVFAIPFTGRRDLFFCRASVYRVNKIRAEVSENELYLGFTITDNDVNKLKRTLDEVLSDISERLSWTEKDVIKFNDHLKSTIIKKLKDRKDKLLKEQGMVAALGIPIRRRRDAQPTYIIPVTRKKLSLPKPTAEDKPFTPEPELRTEIYQEILSTLRNMSLAMELSPKAFSKMKEEHLRFFFLVSLNALFKGQATGETFNFDGKTDILIRIKDKNIFIAECKFWRGAKALKEAIDQLLGYLCWRDTKVAILLFNRNRDLSKVLNQIPNTIKEHSNYKKNFEQINDTEYSFILKSKLDKNRELIATLLVFDIPKLEQ